ncbi:DUF5698 domain-containing protein [Clostridium sp.]|uniref:DUF2179 domain-containing protein n=1 Tax=Clostridium sp. TaxID=1506 RepID=UPI0032166AFB
MIYLMIFVAKLIEVALGTLRMVFITKGERVKGALISFVEICIWIIVAGNVLNGISEDIFKGVAYALGFSVGCYLGSWLEEKIALGTVTLNIILGESSSQVVADKLRDIGVGYTMVDAHGQVDNNILIIAYIPRNRKVEVVSSLEELDVKFFVSAAETGSIQGGYGFKRR